ncbi:MAG TPA: thiamine pyrophosphate-dependent enzyme [Planctomycetota bacterium]|nr:thiamine pyrophosphate-dependent enzyme [Planctomycetota bacterium]HRR81330.1 thiamine pyrophosphate-dependent enzyme [Planctomycetota bacterium]HRT95588.1 thiamine pyrophosphate-dependent enzyme [Planctomycetota bacterium]
MAIRLKDLTDCPELLSGGHRACAGCTAPSMIRQFLLAAGKDTVVGSATGCMEVVTTIYPYTAWRVPFIHNAFENSAATISGAEAAYNALKRRGRIPADKKINFIAMGGDGGTYDIGLQSLSGAMERGHRMLYICYDNHAYMNTGIQRSGATPKGAATSTAPAGKVHGGKEQNRKDLTAIMLGHNLPYLAQASPYNPRDLMAKVQRALEIDGPTFLNVLAPCHRGWRCKVEESMAMARLAVETCFFSLFEVDHGVWKINYKPKEKKPLVEWLKPQGRFAHLFKPGGERVIAELQAEVDRKWQELLDREAASQAKAAAAAQAS